MFVFASFFFGLIILAPALAHAATLENPGNNQAYSGIGVISGWKCEAKGAITVRFDDDERLAVSMVYGSERGPGSYRYSNTGPNTGTLTQNYDDGDVCTARFTFTSATTGTSRYSCNDGDQGGGNWRLE